MASTDFDPVLLDPTRLSIVSLLAGTQWAEFAWVRDSLDLSPSALSKQISTLSNHGYLTVEKGYVGTRPRTWVSLSTDGRTALENHVAGMQRIVDDSRRTATSNPPQPRDAPAK